MVLIETLGKNKSLVFEGSNQIRTQSEVKWKNQFKQGVVFFLSDVFIHRIFYLF